MTQKLYRSTNNKMIAGVCGGIAEYLDLDPTLVRLLWLILGFAMGIGFLAYIVCAVIIPESPIIPFESNLNNYKNTNEFTWQDEEKNKKHVDRNRTLAGIILILLGSIFLIKKTLYWIDFDKLWPILLIIAGVYIIYNKKAGE